MIHLLDYILLICFYLSMLNIIVWNIRGLGNPPSLRRIKKLVRVHNIDCFAIIEPKIKSATAKDYEYKLNCSGSFANHEGNIWVFWKNNISCTVIYSTAQYVHVSLVM